MHTPWWLNEQRSESVRKLANEAWFSQHRDSLDLSVRDMMQRLCAIVDNATRLISMEAAQYILTIRQ